MGKRRDRVKHLLEDKPIAEVKVYTKRRAAVILSIISITLCILTVLGGIFLKARFSDTDAIREWVSENYWIGMLFMTLVCAFQVVIAFIPGELVEIAVGYAYGGWVGAAICIVGASLGSMVAILLARRFGLRLVRSLYPSEKIESLPIINNPRKRNITTFFLFLIPGTPKDLLTYVIGMTSMSIPLYLLLTTAARVPSIIMSTLGGGALGDNKLIHAVVIFIIAAAVSGSGYLLYLWIKKRGIKKSKEENK